MVFQAMDTAGLESPKKEPDTFRELQIVGLARA